MGSLPNVAKVVTRNNKKKTSTSDGSRDDSSHTSGSEKGTTTPPELNVFTPFAGKTYKIGSQLRFRHTPESFKNLLVGLGFVRVRVDLVRRDVPNQHRKGKHRRDFAFLEFCAYKKGGEEESGGGNQAGK